MQRGNSTRLLLQNHNYGPKNFAAISSFTAATTFRCNSLGIASRPNTHLAVALSNYHCHRHSVALAASINRRAFVTASSSSRATAAIDDERQRLKQSLAAEVTAPAKRLPNWFILFPIITAGLGTWQVYRWQWKQSMKADRQLRLSASAVPFADTLTENWGEYQDMAYKRVTLAGQFENEKTMFVGPRAHSSRPGYAVVTPFTTLSGKTVLVHRGWVPSAAKDDVEESKKLYVSGVQQITAVVRPGEEETMYSPQNAPEKGEWYRIEPSGMAANAGMKEQVPVLLQLEDTTKYNNGNYVYPMHAESLWHIRDMHMTYVVTWYSLTILLLFVISNARRRHSALISQAKRM